MSTQTATYSTGVTTTSSQSDVGNFTDMPGGTVNKDLPTSPATLMGTTPMAQNANATSGPPYATNFTLTSTTTFMLSGNGTVLPTDQFTS